MEENQWTQVNFENCGSSSGPFYHGTKIRLEPGTLLSSGHPSNYESSRSLKYIYFSALMEPAIWGAELATAFASSPHRGFIYLVEPMGPFEDDPNLTNKRFPGNPTKSYRSLEPLKIVGVVEKWQGHTPEAIQHMLGALRDLTRRGLDVIED